MCTIRSHLLYNIASHKRIYISQKFISSRKNLPDEMLLATKSNLIPTLIQFRFVSPDCIEGSELFYYSLIIEYGSSVKGPIFFL